MNENDILLLDEMISRVNDKGAYAQNDYNNTRYWVSELYINNETLVFDLDGDDVNSSFLQIQCNKLQSVTKVDDYNYNVHTSDERLIPVRICRYD